MVTASLVTDYTALVWSGFLLCLVPASLAMLMIDREAFEKFLTTAISPLMRPRTKSLALMLAVVATLLAIYIAHFLLAGTPTLVDSFAQLVHARYLAEGMWSGPRTPLNEFWHIQQTVLTEEGWLSQYPPGHIVLLAAGLKVGAAWLVGPLCWGVAVFFTTLALERLVSDVRLARVAAFFTALSPFSLSLSGAYMSHVPAAACAAAALYFVARGRDAHWSNALGAGIATGMLFTIRPLTGVALGVVAMIVGARRPAVIAAGLLGALPFMLGVAFYNDHFFGNPLQFGYNVALGPNAGLGFGLDPWGNAYGPVQAAAYTSAELNALNLFLFESPLPAVPLIGLYFALGKRDAGEWVLFGWAAAPLAANLFYWHHGLFMGPRMLADAGFAWAALSVVSVVGIIRAIRPDWRLAGKYSPRTFAAAAALSIVVFGAIVLLPARMATYTLNKQQRALLKAPDASQPVLVFVHGGWAARVAMKMAARGMRLDSLETALRQNPTCNLHVFADSFVIGAPPPVQLDFDPRATNLPGQREISPGNRIRVEVDEKFYEVCAREVQADQGGVIDVTPLLWQGDLPGLPARGPLFVRDMGPEANQKLMSEHPDRRAFMLVPDADTVRMVPYTIAERAIWGTE